MIKRSILIELTVEVLPEAGLEEIAEAIKSMIKDTRRVLTKEKNIVFMSDPKVTINSGKRFK
jgi:hypothetical protein